MAQSGIAPSLARRRRSCLPVVTPSWLRLRRRRPSRVMLLPEMRYAWMAAGLLLNCSSNSDDALPPPQARLFVGEELDNWAVPPPATHVKIELVQSADGSRSTLAESAAPAPDIVTASAA